jgi:hypothetical protein
MKGATNLAGSNRAVTLLVVHPLVYDLFQIHRVAYI